MKANSPKNLKWRGVSGLPLIGIAIILHLFKRRNNRTLAPPSNQALSYGNQNNNLARFNWQVIFAGLTLVVLIFQLYIYWRQTNIMERQAMLTGFQVDLQREHEKDEMAANAVDLTNAKLAIMFLYPSYGSEAWKELSKKDKEVWINNVRSILDSQSRNPTLGYDTRYSDEWMMARVNAQIASQILAKPEDDIENPAFTKAVKQMLKAAECGVE